MEGLRRVHLHIEGEVQGVGFRFHTQRRAAALGLHGWVRNCPDGTVELEAEGPPDEVRDLIAWAHRGPASADVRSVTVDDLPVERETGGFRIAG